MSLISSMLQEDPANRMTIAEVLEHPWLKEEMASEEEVLEEMNRRRCTISGTTPDAEMPTSDPNIFDKVQQAH